MQHGMECSIREMTAADVTIWAEMQAALWPEESAAKHAQEIGGIAGDYWGFVAEVDGAPIGFAEIAIRNYANGCDSRPVPFLEGIWVAPQFRRRGLAARLLKHIEAFVTARGFCEIGSDADIGNLISHAAHRAWGFSETERVVYFRKKLGERV
jgi:aminoglycoside 6'-N-acetyltransferase I